VPIIDAIVVAPSNGMGICFFKKLPSDGLIPYIKKSSTNIEQHPTHDMSTNIVNTSLN
jgi:hypothetical protein